MGVLVPRHQRSLGKGCPDGADANRGYVDPIYVARPVTWEGHQDSASRAAIWGDSKVNDGSRSHCAPARRTRRSSVS